MTNIIVMAFSPRNIIGYFLTKGSQRGGGGGEGHGNPRTLPRYAIGFDSTPVGELDFSFFEYACVID